MQNISKVTPQKEFVTCTYPQSILQKGQQSSIRYDAQGQQIIKGKGKHQVTFKQNVQKTYIVENWKEYNIEEDQREQSDKCCLLS